jgi:hypothetical protein
MVNRFKKANKWLGFSVNAANQGLNLANTGQQLFGRGKVGQIASAVSSRSARGAIVSQVMREYGLPLGQASKFVKDNGLY